MALLDQARNNGKCLGNNTNDLGKYNIDDLEKVINLGTNLANPKTYCTLQEAKQEPSFLGSIVVCANYFAEDIHVLDIG